MTTLLLPILLFFAPSKSDSTVEFENQWVRIVRVHYMAHEKTRYHDHPAAPTVYVYTTDGGRLRILHDEKEEPVIRPVVKANSIRFNRGANEHHQVEEMDGIASEYLRLELKIEPVELPEKDVRIAAGDVKPFENRMVRMEHVQCAAHALCPTSTYPDRPAVEVMGKKFRWIPPNGRESFNETPAPIEVVRVEFISPPPGKK
jgi:hypothetical protein